MTGVPPIRAVHRLWYALPFVTALILICVLYRSAFQWWWEEWTSPGSFYAHAVFVPFFVGVMIWRNRRRLATLEWNPSWSGLAVLLPALFLLLMAQRLDVTAVQSLSFMALLVGVVLMLAGKLRTRLLLFPLLFVIMMMPLIPDQLINIIAFPIQLKSAELATFLLNLMQLHSVRQGTLIQMDSYQMAVELPCSGFKTLISLMTFTAAFAYLVEAKAWKRWTLFFTTIPLSLFINALRITFIGIVGELISRQAASTFHDYSGFIVLTLAFLFLFNFAKVLRCERFLFIPLSEEEEQRERANAATEETKGGTPWWRELLDWRPSAGELHRMLPYLLAINGALCAALVAQPLVTGAIYQQAPIARYQVPKQFAFGATTWTAVERDSSGKPVADFDALDERAQEALNPMRVIQRIYNGTDGSTIHLFITAGNGRKTFHDPHVCSLGSDAVLTDIGFLPVPTSHGTIVALETHYKRTNEPYEFEMLYFYVIEGKIAHTSNEVRNAIFRQMMFGDSGKPSYFVRVLNLQSGVDYQKQKQMIAFIGGMWDQIGPVLSGAQKGLPDDPPAPMKEAHP